MKISFVSNVWIAFVVLTSLGYFATAPVQGATISANPSTLTFCLATTSDPQPSPQTFTVTSSNGSALSYNATANSSWMLIKSNASGSTGYQKELDFLNTATDSSISVEILPSAYASGSTTSSVAINAAGGSFTDVTINVKVDPSCAPGKGLFNVTPTTLSFNSSQASPTLSVTGNTGIQVVVSAADDSGVGQWLTVSPGAADGAQTAPVTLTVAANSSLGPGTYHGHITIAQATNPGNAITVPVTYTAGGSSGTFTAIPSSLSFGTVQAGTTTRQDLTLNITSTKTVQVTTSATMDQDPAAGWLNIDQPGGQSQSFQIGVHVNPSNLTAGTYTGKVTIQETGNAANFINVLVSVTINGSLTISPSSLSFVYQIGGSVVPQNISVSSPPGTVVNFSVTATSGASCGGNWLSASPSQASTGLSSPTQVSVTINTAGLPADSVCNTGNVQITASGAVPPTTNIPVSLSVSTTPQLQSSISSLAFTSQTGSQPGTQTFSVSSTSTTLTYSTAVTATTSGGPVFLTVSPTSGSASSAVPSLLTVGIDSSVLSQLTPGTYSDTLTISSTIGSPLSIPATLTISSAAALSTNPASIATNYQIGQGQPPDQILTVFSTGSPLQFSTSFTANNCGNFISSIQGSGSTLNSNGQNGNQLSIGIDIAGVTQPTTCTGSVTLTPAGTNSMPLVVPVSVNVVNAPAINVGPPSAVIQTLAMNATPVTVQVPITSTDGTSHLGFTATPATTVPGSIWLNASPQFGGTTPSNLQIQFNPFNTTPGTYTGTVTISSQTSAVPTQIIAVTMIVTALASVSPSSLALTMQQGGANPANKILTVGNIPNGSVITANAATTSGGGWLTAGTSGNTVTVSVNGSSLTAGQYSGTVTIGVPGATNSPLAVGVTLTVTAPVTFAVDNANLTFSANAGATSSPASKTVQLTASNSGAVSFTATAVSQFSFLTVSPSSGTTPASLTIGVNPTVLATLAAGTYTGTVTVGSTATTSTATINATLTVVSNAPSYTTLVSAATLTSGPVSPGELVAIMGVNLGPSSPLSMTLTPSGTVPVTLGGTQVFFDGVAAPLLYVSATQINAIVPYEIAGRAQTTLTVNSNSSTSNSAVYRVADTVPGLFTSNASGAGQAAIVNQDNTINGPSHPAPKGSVISLFGTGEGLLTSIGGGTTASVTSATPPYPKPGQAVTVTFLIPQSNGTTISEQGSVQYYGEAPTLVSGVLQVNVVVPNDVPSGNVNFYITMGSTNSPQVSGNVQ